VQALEFGWECGDGAPPPPDDRKSRFACAGLGHGSGYFFTTRCMS